MRNRTLRLSFSVALAAISATVLASIGAAADSSPAASDDETVQGITITFGGADPLPTTRTVQHWFGQTTNPGNGIAYRYNMVGADPATNGSATLGVDIIPIDVKVQGVSFRGSDRVAGVLASPLFQTNDYSNTDRITTAAGTVSPPGPFALSDGNTGQLIDATMRAQFDKVGSAYHVILDTPTVYEPVTIDVNSDNGVVNATRLGLLRARVDSTWFQTRVQNLMGRLHLDPTHLAVFLTKDVLLYVDHDPMHCCVFGGHGAGHATGGENGPVSANGDEPIQTFVWSSWLTPGLLPPAQWVNKDVSGLTHEITEWAADPFVTNTVQPWTAPNAPQYGCSDILETGDPTFNIGFSAGHNTFDPLTLPNGQPNMFVDGAYHVQDEAFLPWFMRTDPNNTSQTNQSGTGGRYTLMGDLTPTPFTWLRQPAPAC